MANSLAKESQRLVQWRNPETEIRIAVSQWLLAEPITDQYITYPRNFRLLLNYVKKVGIINVLRKIRSRLAEQNRNTKVMAIGVGVVLESVKGLKPEEGELVLFFATNVNPLERSVVLHNDLVVAVPKNNLSESGVPKVLNIHTFPAALRSYKAWTPWSGRVLNGAIIRNALLEMTLQYQIPKFEKKVDLIKGSDFFPAKNTGNHKLKSAVLFGLGNYAKTQIIPNIQKELSLERIHEIDPAQFEYLGKGEGVDKDTSPIHRGDRFFDAWFIAGYHHTHTNLAIDAIQQGATAVIEKPLAVNRMQFDNFVNELKRAKNSQFFACFHKRYSKLHKFFLQDIGSSVGEPVDMHCIVYEIPLPTHHWYNWPNSGSRLISNGCHWLDYFMFVNNYEEVKTYHKWKPKGSDIVVQVKLNNGAYLSMSLTDTGSRRLGVRDYIELRAKDMTITMIDGAVYRSENNSKVISQRRINPQHVYGDMYRLISQKIIAGGEGDSMESLRSTELSICLEELV